MPLYEYQCDKCGSVFEALQRFSDAPLAVHPVCGGPVTRLLSTSAFQFKGTGWYVTDYGKGKGTVPRPANGNGEHKQGANGSAETKSESKTDTKTETNPKATASETAKT